MSALDGFGMYVQFSQPYESHGQEVEATVREAERLHAEHLAGIEAGNRRLKEAEDAKAAAVQAAQTRKLEADHREQTARDAARTEAEAKRKQEKADAIAAEVKKRAAEAKAAGVATSAKPGEAAQEWERWRAKQTSMKHDVIGPVKADSSTRSRLRTGMRLITRGLGQVVNTKEAILRIVSVSACPPSFTETQTDQIHGVLVEQLANRPSPSTPVSTEMNPPEPYLYLLSHTAKGLIKQAENEVNVKPDAAFPLARIVLGLLLRGHAVFGEILFARFVKKCPWVLPFYPPRLSVSLLLLPRSTCKAHLVVSNPSGAYQTHRPFARRDTHGKREPPIWHCHSPLCDPSNPVRLPRVDPPICPDTPTAPRPRHPPAPLHGLMVVARPRHEGRYHRRPADRHDDDRVAGGTGVRGCEGVRGETDAQSVEAVGGRDEGREGQGGQ